MVEDGREEEEEWVDGHGAKVLPEEHCGIANLHAHRDCAGVKSWPHMKHATGRAACVCAVLLIWAAGGVCAVCPALLLAAPHNVLLPHPCLPAVLPV